MAIQRGGVMPRIVWITGASSGIGQALALEYARRGDDIVLTARRAERLENLKNTVENLGQRALVCPGDVRDAERMTEIPTEVERALGVGGIDIAIANAGVVKSGPLGSVSLEDEKRIFDVNVNGVLHTIHAVLPRMRARGKGHLVAISSIAGRLPLPGRAAYVASKVAVTYYMNSIGLQLTGTGITTTAVLPGYVESEITEKIRSKMPFLWSSERAARVICNGVDQGRTEIRFPWQMHTMVNLAQLLPRPLREIALRRQTVERKRE